jgi:signal transduction histidine kinase
VQKHAGARQVAVRARTADDRLTVEVVDDGVGGADEGGGGLRGLADRIEALGGHVTLDSPSGGGTRLRAEIPYGETPEG